LQHASPGEEFGGISKNVEKCVLNSKALRKTLIGYEGGFALQDFSLPQDLGVPK